MFFTSWMCRSRRPIHCLDADWDEDDGEEDEDNEMIASRFVDTEEPSDVKRMAKLLKMKEKRSINKRRRKKKKAKKKRANYLDDVSVTQQEDDDDDELEFNAWWERQPVSNKNLVKDGTVHKVSGEGAPDVLSCTSFSAEESLVSSASNSSFCRFTKEQRLVVVPFVSLQVYGNSDEDEDADGTDGVDEDYWKETLAKAMKAEQQTEEEDTEVGGDDSLSSSEYYIPDPLPTTEQLTSCLDEKESIHISVSTIASSAPSPVLQQTAATSPNLTQTTLTKDAPPASPVSTVSPPPGQRRCGSPPIVPTEIVFCDLHKTNDTAASTVDTGQSPSHEHGLPIWDATVPLIYGDQRFWEAIAYTEDNENQSLSEDDFVMACKELDSLLSHHLLDKDDEDCQRRILEVLERQPDTCLLRYYPPHPMDLDESTMTQVDSDEGVSSPEDTERGIGDEDFLEKCDRDEPNANQSCQDDPFMVDKAISKQFSPERLKHCQRQNIPCYPLFFFCATGWLQGVKACYQCTPELIGNENAFGYPLHYAVHHKAPLSVIEFLVQKFPCAARQTNASYQTPLHLACYDVASAASSAEDDSSRDVHLNKEVIRLLLSCYPTAVELADGRGCTPIQQLLLRHRRRLGDANDDETLSLVRCMREASKPNVCSRVVLH